MNRQQFLKTLKQKLEPLPREEIENAMGYYTEHFDDAGAENEGEVLAKLPHPSHIAVKLLAEFSMKEVENNVSEPKKKSVSILTLVFAILSAPITLPLGFAFVVVALSILLVVFILAFIPLMLGAIFVLLSCISLPLIFFAFAHNFATGLIFLGFFCLSFPISVLVLTTGSKGIKKLYILIKKQLSRMVLRRYNHES